MKRFILLGVDNSSTLPGFFGIVATFDTRVDAVKYAQRKEKKSPTSFTDWHVFDCDERRIVAAESLTLMKDLGLLFESISDTAKQ